MKNTELKVQTCRVCGCTENDCRQCIEKTGGPCSWVEKDLCSACQEQPASTDTPAKPTNVQQSEEAPAAVEPVKQKVDYVFEGDSFFFRHIFKLLDGFKVNLKIEKVEDNLVVNFLPSTGEQLAPYNIKGLPEEIDAEFFKVISAPVEKVAAAEIDLDQYRKNAEAAKNVTPKTESPAIAKSALKKSAAKNAASKKAVKKVTKPVKPEAPDMFA